MKKTSLCLSILSILTGLVIFSSCQKEQLLDEPVFTTDITDETPQPLSVATQEILDCLGFQLNTASETNEYVIIEDDILISKEELSNVFEAEEISASDVVDRQHALNEGLLVNMDNLSGFVKVFIDQRLVSAPTGSANRLWFLAINQALADWNAIPNTRVRFAIASSYSDSQLRILMDDDVRLPAAMRNMTNGILLRACFPSNGQIGKFISLNRSLADVSNFAYADNTTEAAFKVNGIKHQIGHNLGLRHNSANDINCDGNSSDSESLFVTNFCNNLSVSGLNLIAGTPQCDQSSVMRANCLCTSPFSTNDKKSIKYMYPASYNAPAATSITTISLPGTVKTVSIQTNAPNQPVYRFVVKRYSTSGSLVQTHTFNNANMQDFFQIPVPVGNWLIRMSRENYGQYRVNSGFEVLNIQ